MQQGLLKGFFERKVILLLLHQSSSSSCLESKSCFNVGLPASVRCCPNAFVKIAKEEKDKTGKLNIKIRKEGAKELEKHILVVLNLSRNVVLVHACVNDGKIVEGDVGSCCVSKYERLWSTC